MAKRSGRSIGLVPTMGALHEGHINLVRESCRQCDVTVASIFVNPTQFAPGEDLDRYPRAISQDLDKLSHAGVELVFVPETDEIYPPGCTTSIKPPVVAARLEGEFRPTHFAGVCTVVLKLLNLVQPDWAFFGQKDWQQSRVICRMVGDLNVPVQVLTCPTTRDADGLALSSRNHYLTTDQRQVALAINRSLQAAAEEIRSGQVNAQRLMAEMRQSLIDGGITKIDYAVIADPETLELVDSIRGPVVLLIAAYVDQIRLIDNCLIR